MIRTYYIRDTIEYLNSVTGSEYSHADPKIIDSLFLLIKEGYIFDDFKLVIDKKWHDWKGTEWQKYMRPETLFGAKFKKYLNEQPRITKSGLFKLASAVGKAKQTDWKLDS